MDKHEARLFTAGKSKPSPCPQTGREIDLEDDDRQPFMYFTLHKTTPAEGILTLASRLPFVRQRARQAEYRPRTRHERGQCCVTAVYCDAAHLGSKTRIPHASFYRSVVALPVSHFIDGALHLRGTSATPSSFNINGHPLRSAIDRFLTRGSYTNTVLTASQHCLQALHMFRRLSPTELSASSYQRIVNEAISIAGIILARSIGNSIYFAALYVGKNARVVLLAHAALEEKRLVGWE